MLIIVQQVDKGLNMVSGSIESPSFALVNVVLEVKRLNVKAGGLRLPFYSDETQADVVVVVVVGGRQRQREKEKGVSLQNL